MITNIIYISILLAVSVLLYLIVSKSNTKKKQNKQAELPLIKLSDAELEFIAAVNDYRDENGLNELPLNNVLKHFADDRTKFWKRLSYTKDDNLHDLIGLHQTKYINNGFSEIAENSAITAYPFTAFKNSYTHNENMLSEDWDYISVSFKTYKNDVNYVCLAFGKKATKQTWFK